MIFVAIRWNDRLFLEETICHLIAIKVCAGVIVQLRLRRIRGSMEEPGRYEGKPAFFARWFMSTNDKDIGTLYLIFSIVAGILGAAISGMMRLELAAPGIQYLPLWLGNGDFSASLHLWNVLVTAHGLIIIFFVIMPAMVGGFGNWMVPILIGAPDMAFPRMNNMSFWLLAAAFPLFCFPLSIANGALASPVKGS